MKSKTMLIGPLLFILSSNMAFTQETRWFCKKLLNGNYSGKATRSLKSINLELKISTNPLDAVLDGDHTSKNNESLNIGAIFIGKRKTKLSQNIISISSLDKGFFGWCGENSAPCRVWEKLDFNISSGEGVFGITHSYKFWFGQTNDWLSFKFKCEKAQ